MPVRPPLRCGAVGHAGRHFQSGFGLTTVCDVAASAGATTWALPDCHWASRNLPFGSPVDVQLSGPRMVCTVLACSQSRIFAWSSAPTPVTAACSTSAAAYASAASSAGSAFWYAALYPETKSVFFGVLASWCQLTV